MDSPLIQAIEEAIAKRDPKREGQEIKFLCPAHDDRHPSARWNDSKAAWYCDVCGNGGGPRNLAVLLGISLPQRASGSLTLVELADAKALPPEFLRSVGVKEGVSGIQRSGCVDIPYLDASSEVLAVRKRLSLTGNPRF